MNRKLFVRMKRVALGSLLGIILLMGSAHLFVQHRIVSMPGETFEGTPETINEMTRATASRLRKHVEVLTNEIGGRSIYNSAELDKTKAWIVNEFQKIGLEPNVQSYKVEPHLVREAIEERNKVIKEEDKTNFLPEYGDNQPIKVLANVWVEIKGSLYPDNLIVVGAHYDTILPDCPGADDNSTGVAGLLEIARYLKNNTPKLTVLLAAFACEEYPVGGTDKMGSAVFATWLMQDEKKQPVGMIALDMLGYYSDEPGSQAYPPPFNMYYPETADFIGFVSDSTSRTFVRSVVGQFRQIPATVPSQGVAAPVWLVPDVLRSDHEYFILYGTPGVMVTDTANFRYKDHYHKPTDTIEKLDFIKFASVVEGLSRVVQGYEN